MFNYYDEDIIPIILSIFKVKNVIICGLSNKKVINQILSYCDVNNASFTAIDSNNNPEYEYIKDYPLNILHSLENYGAIFLNDDPNWYTVYNELKIIKESNNEFPLVFICNNIFPHKYRDSYINPDLIPEEFRNEFSKKVAVNGIYVTDTFFHAIEENSSKNGVSNAIKDFLSENQSIGIMDIKLLNGITILYPENSISQIRLSKIKNEINGHNLKYDIFSDNIIKNQLLINHISKLNNHNIEKELKNKQDIINDYENKIEIHDDQIGYKNSQINSIQSKLNLKEAEIKNFKSKIVNHENQIDDLENQLNVANNKIYSLESNISQKEYKESLLNNQISSLKSDISQKEHWEEVLNNQISSLKSDISQKDNVVDSLNNQIKNNINQLNKKDKDLSQINSQLNMKQHEINDAKKKLELIERQCINQLSNLDNKEYCISCYKKEIENNNLEIEYLKNSTLTKKLLSPFAYVYLILKSNPKDLSLNLKLYRVLKNSKCFDIGYYLNDNKDVLESNWCKYFSPELHYVCNGFNEKRKFNKRYFNRNSKEELLDYLLNCDY